METLEQVLAEHPFFKGLAEKYFFILAEHATFVTFEADQYIFHQGEEAERFYLITEGKVGLEVVTLSHGSIVIQTIGPNEVLGWSWRFPPYRWHFDARATETTKVVVLDASWLRQKCKEDPELGHEVLERIARLLIERLQATRLQLLDIYGIHF